MARRLRLSLYEHPEGVETGPGNHAVYDLGADEAWFGPARVSGPALRWEVEADGSSLAAGAVLSERLDPLDGPLLLRCDRIDFPPGGVAHRHTHPGPGIRRLLHGAIRIDADGHSSDFGPGEAWFESGLSPVLATASPTVETAFVRVLVLPAEWEGRRTIAYVDPADADKPKLQRARVYFDGALAL